MRVTNSADHLHALFSSWRKRLVDNPGANVGALVDPQAEGLGEVSAAFAWLHVIEDQLILLGERNYNVRVHQRRVREWMRVPLMLETGWKAGVPDPDLVVTTEILDDIDVLSSFLDGKVLDTDSGRFPSLREIIDQADVLLTEDATLDVALAAYIRRLIAEIRHALDNEAAGRLFDFTSAVQRLRFAFQAAAESSEDEDAKQGWRQKAEEVLTGVGVGLAIELAKGVLGITS